ncbi:MAG: FecR family protein [Pseudobacter sp.]|uniref:FecR family protein n=1 Tax=Pseudobacter sp. TaxID=2045420 RepID=UPI003F81D78C
MENEKNQLILIQIKILEGQPLLPAEEEQWKQWEERSASVKELEMDIPDIVLLMDLHEHHLPADELLKRLDEDAMKYELIDDVLVKKEEKPPNQANLAPKINCIIRNKRWLNVAAAVLLPAILLLAYVFFRKGSESLPESMLNASTQIGETLNISWSDNPSKIKLNNISEIYYPESLNGDSNRIQLSGEAYFDIAKRTGKRPLIVSAGFMNIEVIGTRFNVAAYKEDSVIKVTLDEGEIWISNGKQRTKLTAPVCAFVYRDSIPVVTQIQPGKGVAWIDGIFSYSKMPLPEIMKELKRLYGISATYEKFSEEWKNIQYSVPYSRKESIMVILDRLERMGYFEYQPKGKEFKSGDTIRFIRKP